MALNILDELRRLLGAAEQEDADEPPEEAPEDGPDEAAEDDEETPETGDELDPDDEAPSGDTEQDAVDESMPASSVSEGELRDALNALAAENEALRTRIAELAGDDAIPMVDAAEDLVPELDDPEYDDDAAQADIDAQQKIIASLRG